ncbi:MAG: cardiolipin synthase [Clostridia bacterium]|nr:cardiolipin synthase [Clostridia bacterium]
MRKLLKILFSQIVIISLLLILQIALIVYSVLRLSQYFIYFDLFLKLISLIVVIFIMNRHSNPIYKLAWVVPIVSFPLLGGFFYLFIMGQRQTKNFFKRLSTIEKETTKDFVQDSNVFNEIAQNHPERKSTITYINKVSGLNAYRLDEAQYFSVGEEKWKALLCELEKAEKYIFLEYFIIKDGTMWKSILEILKRKAKEGIDVRVMYDGMGSMENFPISYPKTLESYGIKCRVFSPFTPFLSALQNNRDHRKIAVIDGKTAFTGGINLSDEYVNIDYKHGHWKDMSVMIKGEGAFSFAIMFLQLWSMVSGEKPNPALYRPEYSAPQGTGYVMGYADIPLDKYQTGEFVYLDIINKAKKYVYITTPYLILDHEMVVALTNAALSGIDVKIICPLAVDHWYARAVAYSYYKELIESGVKIYEYTPGFIHGKTFCSDGEICVVGSINLDYRSLYLHFECASLFIDSPVVQSVYSDFKETLKKCRLITKEECDSIPPHKKILYAILRLFAPLM